jgi:hypothetical protein
MCHAAIFGLFYLYLSVNRTFLISVLINFNGFLPAFNPRNYLVCVHCCLAVLIVLLRVILRNITYND